MNLELGKNLKKHRREKDMTQDELAQALSLSVQAISRYETGAAYPDIEMLPVIAGFFGTTVDDLLGVSSAVKEKRIEEYGLELRKITDRAERLALLRRQHAEFPEDWSVVSDMVYQMVFLPEYLDEMRNIVNDAVRRCEEPLWRENIIIHYLHAESDEEKALEFIEKWSSRYNMMKVELLRLRYSCRNENEKLKSVSQKILVSGLKNHLLSVATSYEGMSADDTVSNCENVLEFLCNISNNKELTKPDMWISEKLRLMLFLANYCFAAKRDNEGFEHLKEAVELFENFFALPNGTVLTYGAARFNTLIAKTAKEAYYKITEFTGMITESMMMNLVYEKPVDYVDEDAKHVYDMEGFTREMVFSRHTYDILKNASWNGFSRVKNDERYRALLYKVKMVTTFENLDNVMYIMNAGAARTDDFVNGMKWCSLLYIGDVGAYIVFDSDEMLKEKMLQMEREGNTKVERIVTMEFGGGIIVPPENLLKAVVELNEENKNADVLLSYDNSVATYEIVDKLYNC